jgi:TPR repeat protein
VIPGLLEKKGLALVARVAGKKKSRESALYDKNVLTFYETKALAEKGDSEAQQNLGNMYNTANGVPENDAESVKWYKYRKDADRGHPDA